VCESAAGSLREPESAPEAARCKRQKKQAHNHTIQTMSEFGVKEKSADDDDDLTAIERFLNKAYNGICGVLFIMSKDTASTPTLAMVGMLVDFLQRTFVLKVVPAFPAYLIPFRILSVLAFNFYASMHWHWNSSIVGWLSAIVRTAFVATFN
jgi:hypothetical protein